MLIVLGLASDLAIIIFKSECARSDFFSGRTRGKWKKLPSTQVVAPSCGVCAHSLHKLSHMTHSRSTRRWDRHQIDILPHRNLSQLPMPSPWLYLLILDTSELLLHSNVTPFISKSSISCANDSQGIPYLSCFSLTSQTSWVRFSLSLFTL